MSTYQDLQGEVDKTFEGIRSQKKRFANVLNSLRDILIKQHGIPEKNVWFELPQSENSNVRYHDATHALALLSSIGHPTVRLVINTEGSEGFITIATSIESQCREGSTEIGVLGMPSEIHLGDLPLNNPRPIEEFAVSIIKHVHDRMAAFLNSSEPATGQIGFNQTKAA
jgi:hypothetical protein